MSDSALQGSLLRLVVLSSTGLATFLSNGESAVPEGIHHRPQSSSNSSSSPSTSSSSLPTQSHFATVRAQMRQDALTIFNEIGKRCTNFSLALKRSSSQTQAEAQAQTSPTSGLDAASIAAAQQQIDALTTDLLPKLVFLAQKASKERSVYVVRDPDSPETANAAAASEEERRKLEEVAKEMGGKVMTGAELGLSPAAASASSAQYVKQANLGIGATWARILRVHTQDVLHSVASLGEACMDARTKKAVRAAQRARDRFDGVQASEESTEEEGVATREQCLAKTAAIWDACDQAVKSLPTDNLAAVKKRWKDRAELMQDGLEEMKEAVEEGSGAEQGDADDNDDDDLGLSLSTMTLDGTQRKLISRLVPLIRMGRLLHDRVGHEIKGGTGDEQATDIDELDTKGTALAEAQDDLVAALLYGEDADEDEEEEEDEEEDAPENAIRLTGTRAIAELYLDAARQLLTSEQDAKAQMIVEEMVKLVDGIEETAWPPRAE